MRAEILDWQNMDICTILILVSRMTVTYTWNFLAAWTSTKVSYQDQNSSKMDSSSMLPPTTSFCSCLKQKLHSLPTILCPALTQVSSEAFMKIFTWPTKVTKIKLSKPCSIESWRAKTQTAITKEPQRLTSTTTGSLKTRLSSTGRELQTGVITSLEALLVFSLTLLTGSNKTIDISKKDFYKWAGNLKRKLIDSSNQ